MKVDMMSSTKASKWRLFPARLSLLALGAMKPTSGFVIPGPVASRPKRRSACPLGASQAPLDNSVLPPFFRDVEIVGNAEETIPIYRDLHVSSGLSQVKEEVPVTSDTPPTLLTSKSVRETYQSCDFERISELEKQSNHDLKAIYDNVSRNGDKAWTKVRKDGKEWYMSWSNKGSMWSMTDSVKTLKTELADGSTQTTHQVTVQVGTYTKNARVVGLQTYNLQFGTVITESVIALIMARAVSGIIADGLGFAVAAFSLYLTEAAANLGLASFSFGISTAAISFMATTLVFAVVFIGLAYLFDWLNRKYTIRLQVFNWDPDNGWAAGSQYMSNAKIPGENEKWQEFTLPKLVPAGSVVAPPGFDPVEATEAVCYYASVIWENDNTFMEGCSMAIQLFKESSASNKGLMWAFDCPRWSDNQQAAKDGIQEPKDYRNNANWSKTPKLFHLHADGTPITVAVDALSGASDGLYNPIVHINLDQLPAAVEE